MALHLGATATVMFPDQIDKMFLDGVLNPFDHCYEKSFVSRILQASLSCL